MKCWGVLLFVCFPAIIFAQTDSLIISEIMFYPSTGNNEFIELYNLGSSDINLLNFKIKYYTSSPDSITSAGHGTILKSHQYAVILEGDYDFSSGIYKNLIPPAALILKINNNYFGSTGMANTSSRPVWLLSPKGDSLTSYFYTANNPSAYSDEKKLLNIDTSSSFWSNSLQVNGTPGFKNSNIQSDFDLQISSMQIEPNAASAGDDVTISVKIHNNGILPAEHSTIFIYYDVNSDSMPSLGESFYSNYINNLPAGDSIAISTTFNCESEGIYNFIAEVNFPADQNKTNNISIKGITVSQGFQFNSVIINEIMYAPQNQEPEWVEIYNNSSTPVNLKNWMIGDALSCAYISTHNLIINPKSYRVLTKDSSIAKFYPFNFAFTKFSLPSLNNTGDAVILFDSLGRTVDSLFYLPIWGGMYDKSLERINFTDPSTEQSSWLTCTNIFKATPGFINSVSPKENDLSINQLESLYKYAVLGKPVTFRICVKNNGKNIQSTIPLKLFRDADADSTSVPKELMKEFLIPEILPGDSLFYSCKDSSFKAGVNYYIAVLDFPDEDTLNNIQYFSCNGIDSWIKRKDVVINEIMHSPSGEPEWIEVYNSCPDPINLKNFRIADASDTVYLVKEDFIIRPEEYAVISSDSLLTLNRHIPSGFIKCPIPSFNNSGDCIILIDSIDQTIDSLCYTPEWGGENGYSIEKMNPLNPSELISEWSTSLNRYRGTPGYINSVSPKSYDAELTRINKNPIYPVKGDTINISVSIKNRGSHPAWINVKLWNDIDGNDIPENLAESSSIFLQGYDSLEYSMKFNLVLNRSCEFLCSAVDLENDEDTSNNYLSEKIFSGYSEKSIVINEIMFDPSPVNCEFVEFFNRSGSEVNIRDWHLEDGSGNSFILSDSNFTMTPGKYFIFAADSVVLNNYPAGQISLINTAGTSSLNLGNSTEKLFLKDINGSTIDSVYFSSSFHNRNFLDTKNRSIERISPELTSTEKSNWSSSTNPAGATPGIQNSIFTNGSYKNGGISISPDPFSPDNDGWEDFAMINYNFSTKAPQLRMKIFDSSGRLLRTLADNLPSGSTGSIIFDGRDDYGKTLRIGIYILYAEAAGIGGTEYYKIPFVVARKL